MIALLVAVALMQSPQEPDTRAVRAESLLAAGRAHFAGRIVGRYPALEAFRAAARLVPTNPEPLYWQMKVGFYLGGDEGCVIARDAILRILALTPDYADVWDRFQALYHNADIWRKADRALARHPDALVALERRAELAVALEEPARADSLLGEMLSRGARGVVVFLRRAEAGFIANRDSAGYQWYDSAMAHADADSAGAMWDAVWMIATPDEVAAQDAVAPGERRFFFERFWAKRDPNLLTAGNERIAEHFRRFVYARRYFRLLHPLSAFSRSPRWRAIIMQTQRDFLERRGKAFADPYPGLETDRLLAASRQLPDVAPGAATSSALSGLDARGVIYMRHGPPDQRLGGYFDPLNPVGSAESALDVEGWLYRTPAGMLTIGFRRASGSTDPAMAGGDFIFVPTNRRQARSTEVALRTDRSVLPAPLTVRGWSAFFQSGELGLTDAYYKAQGDSAAAVLWDAVGWTVRASGPGVLHLPVPPGGYDLGLDVDSAGVLGRARSHVVVPRFSAVDLGVSSFALAPGSVLLDRTATLHGMPADLTYAAGTPLASYVEIYGLTTDQGGRSHYRLQYRFAPVRSLPARLLSGGARPVVFEFDRETASSMMAERLIVEPDKLAAGRYRVTLAVTDLLRNVKSESVAIDIVIR